MNSFFPLLLKHYRRILAWGLIIGIIAAGFSLLSPKYYSAESQVLIISRDRSGADPYTQAKAAGQVGENLAQVMRTTDFFDKVMTIGVPFNRDRWNALNDRDRRTEWQKTVDPQVVFNTSLLKITTYSSTKDDAVALGEAVSQTLATQGWEYVSGDVAIKEVSSPLPSWWISRPNVILNGGLGFALGLVLAGVWMVKYRRHSLLGG